MSLNNTINDITPIIRGLIKDQSRSDGRDAYSYDNDNKFTLSESFVDSTSIKVFQNGTEINAVDFAYDPDTNQVIIVFVTSGQTLNTNDIIVITYNYFKKYSDTEIAGYIKSCLSYFVQHRYKKIFEIDSNDNIVSINDTQPNIEELYFISMITAICIDPENVEVKIGTDFQLTANRDNSDQEQIAKAFAYFQRFVGKITFEDINNHLDKR